MIPGTREWDGLRTAPQAVLVVFGYIIAAQLRPVLAAALSLAP